MPIEEDITNSAIVYADLTHGTLGNRSRLATPLGGIAILTRTIEQIQKAKRVDQIMVFCPTDQVDKVGALLKNTTAIIHGITTPPPPNKQITKRKWALSSWRGGISDALIFDEANYCSEIVEIAKEASVYFVLSIAPEASFIEPDIIDGIIEQYQQHGEAYKFTFAHTAPGLSCCGYRIDLFHNLIVSDMCIGHLLSYNPEKPQQDFINRECAYTTPIEWCTPEIRFIPDTQRHFDAFEALFEAQPSLAQSCTTDDLIKHIVPLHQSLNAFPHELEIEINTSPTLRTTGYPHSQMAHTRPEMPYTLFKSIIDQCRDHDDICITLGGFGEPLQHAELIKMVHYAHDHGIFGINIETDGIALKGDLAKALLDAPIDTLSVHLDANSPQAYEALKQHDYFDQLTEQIESFIDRSKAINGPLIIPHLTKSLQTLKEMESFHQKWLTNDNALVIQGYNNYCDQITDHAVMDMSPPSRNKCHRLYKIMMIFSNGDVPICSQDFKGTHLAGNLTQTSLEDIWHSDTLTNLRQAHLDGQYATNPLCAKCKEWHR